MSRTGGSLRIFELEGSMKAVLSALTVTALAFVLIFGLDKVAEAWP